LTLESLKITLTFKRISVATGLMSLLFINNPEYFIVEHKQQLSSPISGLIWNKKRLSCMKTASLTKEKNKL